MATKSTLPALSLRQILLVHLIVFQEAVFGYQFYEFDFIKWTERRVQPIAPADLFSWDHDSELRRPDPARLSSDSVYRASIMRNNCDTFCAIMQRFVDSNIQALLDLVPATKWRTFIAIPQFCLIEDIEELFLLVGHSVLVVTDSNDEEHIFDGTIDQYGWDWKTHWLMTKAEVMSSHHINPDDGFQGWTGDKDDFRTTLGDVKHQRGYWAVASRRIEQMFQEVDWMSLRGQVEDDIEARIRSLSRARFAGTYEEAAAQWEKSF